MLEHPPAVVLVVMDGDEVVLVRQPRPGAAGDVLELPAGSVEPGESVLEAAHRELAEECGLAVDGWAEIGAFWTAPEYSTERVTVLAGSVAGAAEAEHDDDETIEVVRLPVAEALLALEDAGSIAAFALALQIV